MNLSEITKTLVSEIKLTENQAKIFLHIVIHGRMNTTQISNDLHIYSIHTKLVLPNIKYL